MLWFNISSNNKCRDRKCKIGPWCGRNIFIQKSRNKKTSGFSQIFPQKKDFVHAIDLGYGLFQSVTILYPLQLNCDQFSSKVDCKHQKTLFWETQRWDIEIIKS